MCLPCECGKLFCNYYIRKRKELTLKPTHKADIEDNFAFSFFVCMLPGWTIRMHRSFYFIELFINTSVNRGKHSENICLLGVTNSWLKRGKREEMCIFTPGMSVCVLPKRDTVLRNMRPYAATGTPQGSGLASAHGGGPVVVLMRHASSHYKRCHPARYTLEKKTQCRTPPANDDKDLFGNNNTSLCLLCEDEYT